MLELFKGTMNGLDSEAGASLVCAQPPKSAAVKSKYFNINRVQ